MPRNVLLFYSWYSSDFRRWRFNQGHLERGRRVKAVSADVSVDEWAKFEEWEAQTEWLDADDYDDVSHDADVAWEEAYLTWRSECDAGYDML